MTLCSLESGEAFLSPVGSLFVLSHLLLYFVLSSYCASSFVFFISPSVFFFVFSLLYGVGFQPSIIMTKSSPLASGLATEIQ